jgi:uncharacterized protein YihD (DUF1040 family)
MRDPERIDRMIQLLRDTWSQVPDWRLTQLVINASDTQHDCGPVFYLEDDELERRLQRLLGAVRNRTVQAGANDK